MSKKEEEPKKFESKKDKDAKDLAKGLLPEDELVSILNTSFFFIHFYHLYLEWGGLIVER